MICNTCSTDLGEEIETCPSCATELSPGHDSARPVIRAEQEASHPPAGTAHPEGHNLAPGPPGQVSAHEHLKLDELGFSLSVGPAL
jgi:hypothetical protein